ncbi:hypothetical protein L1887_18786 [Cichorium endivia]|nr:hypothetical protein L1887_18786 [Cichorium endivia]
MLPPALFLPVLIFEDSTNCRIDIVRRISPENDWNSNRASTVSQNPIGILPETLVPIRVVGENVPEPELDNIQGFGDGVVVTNDPEQRSRGRQRRQTSELSDSSIRCTYSCSTELNMGCELPIARHASINIKKLKANLEKENVIESCIKVTLYRKEEKGGWKKKKAEGG